MWMLVVDALVFFYMTFLAISERGTLTGWLATIAVLFYAAMALMRLRDTKAE